VLVAFPDHRLNSIFSVLTPRLVRRLDKGRMTTSLIREESGNDTFHFPQRIFRLQKVHGTFCDPIN
jgi:hypothetical protein